MTEMVPFESLGMVFYSPSIVTMVVSLAILLLSEQCRVKLTAGRVKSQGGVDGIADVINKRKKLLFYNNVYVNHG